jgi:hypothetical protein
MSYRFADSLRAGSGCSILILLASCQQTCMTYTIAVCTVKNSWWWTEELSETCRVSFPKKIEKLVHLVGFIIRICDFQFYHLFNCSTFLFSKCINSCILLDIHGRTATPKLWAVLNHSGGAGSLEIPPDSFAVSSQTSHQADAYKRLACYEHCPGTFGYTFVFPLHAGIIAESIIVAGFLTFLLCLLCILS